MKLTQTTGQTLGGQKPKGRKHSTFFKDQGKGDLKHGNLKRDENAEKCCTNEGTS